MVIATSCSNKREMEKAEPEIFDDVSFVDPITAALSTGVGCDKSDKVCRRPTFFASKRFLRDDV